MSGGLVDLHGQPLRQSMGYSGGGSGFGGQLAEWLPAPESADVALLPSIQLGNARADDLVRNNGTCCWGRPRMRQWQRLLILIIEVES